MKNNLIVIAKVLRPHGIDGRLKVESYSRDLNQYKNIFIDNKQYNILSIKPFKQFYFIKLDGIFSVEQAKLLQNKNVFVERQALFRLNNDEHFIADVLGSKLYIENEPVGIVKNIDNYGSADVYSCIDEKRNTTFRFPFLSEIIESMDIENKIIVANSKIRKLIVYDEN